MTAPVININTSGAFGLTNLDTADTTTGWAGWKISSGGTPTAVQDTDIFLQGTAAVSAKISGTGQDKGVWYNNGTGVDMTVSGRHLYIWVAVTTFGATATIANSGISIIVSTSGVIATDYLAFAVGGGDFTQDSRFIRYVIDLNKTPTRSVGSTNLASIQYFGAGIKIDGTIKSENLIVDRVDYGDGLQIEAGQTDAPAEWESFFVADDSGSNKYGVIEKRSGVYYLKGGITIGDPTGTVTTLWKDVNSSQVVFEDPVYHNGDTLVSSIDAENLYKIELVGNGTGTTDITFGQVVGSGDDRQGLDGGSIKSDGPKFELDAETDIADLDTVNFYGTRFEGAGLTKFSSSTKTDLIGCTWSNCDEVQANDAEVLNCTVIAPIPDLGFEWLSTTIAKKVNLISGAPAVSPADRVWQVNASPFTVVDQTTAFNNDTSGDVTPFPPDEAVGDYFAIGNVRKFGGISIDTGTARSGGTLVWQYWNGSGWEPLQIRDDHTNTLSTVTFQPVDWNVPVNWETTQILDESPLYYVRLLVNVVMTTNPILDEGDIIDLQEHLIHIPVAGSYDLDEIKCFGSGIHVATTLDGTTEDSYSLNNQNTTLGLATTAGPTGRGQSFTATNTAVVTGARVKLQNSGFSISGNLVAKIYAHSGTYGTSSVPTGPALATSVVVDYLSLPETKTVDTFFEFEDGFQLTATTQYCLTIESDTLNAGDDILIGADDTSPVHGGNAMTLDGTWSAIAGTDLPFFVTTGASVTANRENSSVFTTGELLGTNPGNLLFGDTRAVVVTGVTQGTRVSVQLADGTAVLDGLAYTVDPDLTAPNNRRFGVTYSSNQIETAVARARSSGKPSSAGFHQNAGAVTGDETAEANDVAANMTLLPTPASAGDDEYYFGHQDQFGQMFLIVETAGIGTYTLTWEYWDGDSWEALTGPSEDFKATGKRFISWTIPGDWATTSVAGLSNGPFYYIRARRSSGTVTTAPVGGKITLDVQRYLPFDSDVQIPGDGITVRATWTEDNTATFPASS